MSISNKNLKNLPTRNDLEFGKIAAVVCLDHNILIAKGKTGSDVGYLSEKIAVALKKFRADKRKERIAKNR